MAERSMIVKIRGVVVLRIRGLCPAWSSSCKTAGFVCMVLLSLALEGCTRPPSSERLTLTFLDPGTSPAEVNAALQGFTQETGIQVKHLPAPESSVAQLALLRNLLQAGSVTPDVYGIDVIWPGILNEYLIDLKPSFTSELSSEDPELVANFTVKNRLVAMPYRLNIGVLFYRTDLLLKYGYQEPPRTWDQLEKMSTRIQEGERSKGEKDFWGFAWPGAAGEGLTCNALEWQISEGGGRIIEADKKISVNNPGTIRAWERATRWVDWISPPSVVLYQEWDASNIFWASGRAAFHRGWISDYYYSLSNPTASPLRAQAGVTSIPGGTSGRLGTLGGFGLGISRFSAHRPEALKLVRFLLRREAQLEQARSHSEPPRRPEQYELPNLLKAYAGRDQTGETQGSGVVARPSTITGPRYDAVSQAYVRILHSVLTGKVRAPEAAAALERELVGITGFEAGQPRAEH